MRVDGLQSNKPFLSAVLDEADFRAGRIHTGYIDEHFPEGFVGTAPTEAQLQWMTAASAYAYAIEAHRMAGISGRITPADDDERLECVVILDGQRFGVEVQLDGLGSAQLWVPALSTEPLTLNTVWTPGQGLFEGELNGDAFALEIAPRTEGYGLRHRGYAATALVCAPRTADLHAKLPEKEPVDMAKLVVSPMPGLVVSVAVEAGQSVKAGEALLVVEAMKMENVLRAEVDGVIKTVSAEPGASVAADELLIEFE
jgi:propionyl-CoA carboxylase alpha chain